jgi:thioredoxin reductase (NADPH)
MTDKIIMYGAQWCPDCRRTKDFLDKNNLQYEYIDLDVSAEASQIVESINNGKKIIPTLIINGQQYSNPQNHQLSALLGINVKGKVVLYGADWCPDCRRAKRFLLDNQINYKFIDIDKNADAVSYVTSVNYGKRIIPTILINDKPFSNPSNETLYNAFELSKSADNRIYDVVIIGGGASGLTAAIYAQRDKYDTLILERKNIGGNAFITKKIENYPGFKEVTGPALMDKMAEQASTLGAKIEIGFEVNHIEKFDAFFKIHTASQVFSGRSIVVATGSAYKLLGIPGEEALIGSGIHFCATCDGAFYRDKEVIVVGGGNSALEEGMFLAGFCKKITIVHRAPAFSATETYIEKLTSFNNIKVMLNNRITQFVGDINGNFKSAILNNNTSGETNELYADGVFIFIGQVPNTGHFESSLNLSQSKHIITKGLNKTNIEGIFAAGDCRQGAIAQVAAATGEGVVASYGVREYLSQIS